MTNQEFSANIEKYIASSHIGLKKKGHSTIAFKHIRSALKGLKQSPGKDLIVSPSLDNFGKETFEYALADQMLWFDALANRLRDRHQRKLEVISAATLVFLWSFPMYEHWEKHIEFQGIGLLCFLSGWFVFLRSGRKNQLAFLLTRTTTEILRIKFFLSCSGKEVQPEDYVQRRYAEPLHQVTSVVTSAIKEAKLSHLRHELKSHIVKEQWFDDQKAWFRRKQKELGTLSKRWYVFARVLFALGLIFVAISSFLTWKLGADALAMNLPREVEHYIPSKVLATLGAVFLSSAAISEFYRERMGFGHIAERYEQSITIYEPKVTEWDHQVVDVGQQAVQEVIDWYVASYEREICVPLGG